MELKTITKLVVTKTEYERIVYLSSDEASEAVKEDCDALRYVKDQTEAVCLEAVKRNGDALQYVKDQTEAVCLEAVKEDGYALQYVDRKLVVVEESEEVTA